MDKADLIDPETEQRYIELCHAMQTGVATKLAHSNHETSPKHLRVGVNMAMVSHSALAWALIEAGVITKESYWAKVLELMEQEVVSYEAWLSEHLGAPVHLL